MIDLSKPDKKVVRQLLNKGEQEDFFIGMQQIKAAMLKWDGMPETAKESYYHVYSAVTDFDKFIERRYDRLGGSRYMPTLISQVYDGLIKEEELDILSEELRNYIIRTVSFLKNS